MKTFKKLFLVTTLLSLSGTLFLEAMESTPLIPKNRENQKTLVVIPKKDKKREYSENTPFLKKDFDRKDFVNEEELFYSILGDTDKPFNTLTIRNNLTQYKKNKININIEKLWCLAASLGSIYFLEALAPILATYYCSSKLFFKKYTEKYFQYFPQKNILKKSLRNTYILPFHLNIWNKTENPFNQYPNMTIEKLILIIKCQSMLDHNKKQKIKLNTAWQKVSRNLPQDIQRRFFNI